MGMIVSTTTPSHPRLRQHRVAAWFIEELEVGTS